MPHTGNRATAPEEVEAIRDLVASLLGSQLRYQDAARKTRPLRLDDILVVAPFNAHVGALSGALPPGARVGTVDKFQGQEAPIVLYAMASSSTEDAPRGLEFLFSLHRLNVATSRAKALCILVAAPNLFRVDCRTPQQIALVNAHCRYLELARTIEPTR